MSGIVRRGGVLVAAEAEAEQRPLPDDVEVGAIDADPSRVLPSGREHARCLGSQVGCKSEGEAPCDGESGQRDKRGTAAGQQSQGASARERSKPGASCRREDDRHDEERGCDDPQDRATHSQCRGPGQRKEHRVGEGEVVPKERHHRISLAPRRARVDEGGTSERGAVPIRSREMLEDPVGRSDGTGRHHHAHEPNDLMRVAEPPEDDEVREHHPPAKPPRRLERVPARQRRGHERNGQDPEDPVERRPAYDRPSRQHADQRQRRERDEAGLLAGGGERHRGSRDDE